MKICKIILLGMFLLLLVGCTKDDLEKDGPWKEDPEVIEKEQKEKTEDETGGCNVLKVSIYYIGEDGDLQSEEIEWNQGDSLALWSGLQGKGILNVEGIINFCEVNEEQGTIDIDVNKSFGEYIRGMGTTGEQEILTCIVNTYLDAYQCKKLKITEEGQALETGHRVLDTYLERQELK